LEIILVDRVVKTTKVDSYLGTKEEVCFRVNSRCRVVGVCLEIAQIIIIVIII